MHERQHLYIDGAWVEPNGDGTIQVVNPANEGIIGSVPVGSESDANAAVEAARAAFDSWSESTVDERSNYLNLLSSALKERGEELAELITSEVGTPIDYSRMAMVGTPRVGSRSFAMILDGFVWE